jgi:hypothetical protein
MAIAPKLVVFEEWCRRMDSNHRRAELHPAALPLSYIGTDFRMLDAVAGFEPAT